MLSSYIGEGMATNIVDGLTSYLSGSPPQAGQPLFGNSSSTIPSSGGSGGPVGPSPLPQMSSPFGGLDMASIIGNLGSMFIRGQNTSSQPMQPTQSAQPVNANVTMTPRFRPAYDE